MSVSPDGSRLAAGTRAGMVRVHALEGYRAKPSSQALFEVFHGQDLTTGVLALAFVTNEILASGGQDGRIKFWDLPLRKQIGEIVAHPAGVVALCPLGSLVLASIGMDGVLRVWDLDTLDAKHEGEPFTLPQVAALTGLDFHPQSGLLVHASGTGDLHAYDARSGFAHRVVCAHQGDFCAIACGVKHVATAGREDLTIRLWSPALEGPTGEFAVASPIVSAAWAGADTLVTVAQDGQGQVWDAQSGRCASLDTAGSNLRVCTGLPLVLITELHAEIERSWCESTLARAKALMPQKDADSRRELNAVAGELRGRGYSVVAGLLLAGAARADNRPLRELEALLALVEELREQHPAAHLSLMLGDLLGRMNEAEAAKAHYLNAASADGEVPGIQERIRRLESHPWRGVCPAGAVRADLVEDAKVYDELEKNTLLNRKLHWRVIFETRCVGREQGVVSLADVVEAAKDDLRGQEVDLDSLRSEQVTFLAAEERRQVRWLYVPRVGADEPLAYALEAQAQTHSTTIVVHGVFDAARLEIPSCATAKEHNEQVREAWRRLRHSSRTKSWLAGVHPHVAKGLRRVAGRQGHGW